MWSSILPALTVAGILWSFELGKCRADGADTRLLAGERA